MLDQRRSEVWLLDAAARAFAASIVRVQHEQDLRRSRSDPQRFGVAGNGIRGDGTLGFLDLHVGAVSLRVRSMRHARTSIGKRNNSGVAKGLPLG